MKLWKQTKKRKKRGKTRENSTKEEVTTIKVETKKSGEMGKRGTTLGRIFRR